MMSLDDRTYIGGDANDLARFAESAVNPDEKHPLAAALRKAGSPTAVCPRRLEQQGEGAPPCARRPRPLVQVVWPCRPRG